MSIKKIGEGVYQLLGDYTKFTVPKRAEELEKYLTTEDLETLDLSEIGKSDSVLLALLVEIKRAHPQVKFINFNETLTQLLSLYQADDLLN